MSNFDSDVISFARAEVLRTYQTYRMWCEIPALVHEGSRLCIDDARDEAKKIFQLAVERLREVSESIQD